MTEENKFAGFAAPEENWSKLPHALIDAFPLFTSQAEILCVLYILRHTWGYHDTEKRITLDEFMHGRKRRDGSRIDNGIGMAETSVIRGLKAAEEHGFILVEKDETDLGRISKSYSLNMSSSESLGLHKRIARSAQANRKSEQRKKPKEETIDRSAARGAGIGSESELNTELKNALCLYGWKISPEEENAPWWNIAPLAAWLQGKNIKPHPRAKEWIEGLKTPATVQEIEFFYTWYAKETSNAAVPTTPTKFADWFLKFRAAHSGKSLSPADWTLETAPAAETIKSSKLWTWAYHAYQIAFNVPDNQIWRLFQMDKSDLANNLYSALQRNDVFIACSAIYPNEISAFMKARKK